MMSREHLANSRNSAEIQAVNPDVIHVFAGHEFLPSDITSPPLPKYMFQPAVMGGGEQIPINDDASLDPGQNVYLHAVVDLGR